MLISFGYTPVFLTVCKRCSARPFLVDRFPFINFLFLHSSLKTFFASPTFSFIIYGSTANKTLILVPFPALKVSPNVPFLCLFGEILLKCRISSNFWAQIIWKFIEVKQKPASLCHLCRWCVVCAAFDYRARHFRTPKSDIVLGNFQDFWLVECFHWIVFLAMATFD